MTVKSTCRLSECIPVFSPCTTAAGARPAGKFRGGTPDRFDDARTESWSAECHFLLARIDGDQMTVRAIAEEAPGAASLADIVRRSPRGEVVTTPMDVRR